MTPHTPTRITPHLVVGLCIMALGVLLILDRLDIVPAAQSLQFWPVALILFGASLAYQAFRGGSSDADTSLHRGRHRSPIGLFILVILVGVIYSHAQRRDVVATGTGDRAKLFAMMGGDRRASFATNFRGADMTSIMGGTSLDLRSATIVPGQDAVIDVFALMGGAIIRVPQGWTVDVQVTQVMGGVNDNRRRGVAGGTSAGDERLRRRRDRGPNWDWDSDDTAEAGPAPAPTPVPAPTPASPSPDTTSAAAATSAGPNPRLVVRGFVMWGGVVIRN